MNEIKGCEYCRGEIPMALDYNNDWVIIQENDGDTYMEGADWEKRIKFCPMCGRKLVNGNE